MARSIGDEADPMLWWRDLLAAAAQLAIDDPDGFSAIRGIAACGISRTPVFLVTAGDAVRPAIGFGDTRAGAVLASVGSRAHPTFATPTPHPPAARLLWLTPPAPPPHPPPP